MAVRRGTSWRDAVREFIPAFVSFALPAFLLLVTGIADGILEALEAGKTPSLTFGLWFEALVSILLGAFGAGVKVLAYKYTTTRGTAA